MPGSSGGDYLGVLKLRRRVLFFLECIERRWGGGVGCWRHLQSSWVVESSWGLGGGCYIQDGGWKVGNFKMYVMRLDWRGL